jgi:hypothetical protein
MVQALVQPRSRKTNLYHSEPDRDSCTSADFIPKKAFKANRFE